MVDAESIGLKYSETLVKSAVRAFWWKQVGPVYLLVLAVLAGYVMQRAFVGDYSFLVGVVFAFTLMATAIVIALYFVQMRRGLARFRAMQIPEVVFQFGQDGLKASSDLGTSEIKWTLITELRQFERFWLLCFSSSEHMTLPIEGLSEKHRAFIVNCLEKVGAKIH